MTDRFKFRIWNGEQMVSPDYITRDGYGHWKEDSIPNSSNKLMQCTGLKDVEGKLIYEGDLIQEDSLQTIYEVRFDNVEWIKYILVDKSAGYRVLNTKKSYKIVGNIYETVQE